MIRKALKGWYDGYNATGKFWLTLGIAALIVDAAISYQYGITLTVLHGLGFALVAIFFALLPDAAYSEIESRRTASGIALALLCIPLGTVAFYSHLGYGAGVRVGDMQQTGVQNTKFDDARASLESDRTNIEMWRKQLSDLKSQNAWAATVTADGLRAQLDSAQLAIDLEAKRKGCKSKCLALMEKKAALEDKIATTEQVKDLTDRIEATQRIIDKKTEVAANTDFKSSAVVNQNNVAAQMFLAFTGAEPAQAINPDNVTSSFTSIFIAGGGSLAFMIMAPVGFFVAGRNRRRRQDDEGDDDVGLVERREAAKQTDISAGLVRINQPLRTLPVVQPAPQSTDPLEAVRKMLAELTGNTQIFHDRATARVIVDAIDSVKNQPAMA